MKKMIKSLANKAICAAFVVLGAMSVCAAGVRENITDNNGTVVGYKVTGLGDDQNETAVVFTKTGTTISWTVPATLKNVQFLVVGGGGGAGGCCGDSAGAGGGGGAVITGIVEFTKNDKISVTVGKGGTGGDKDTSSPFPQGGSLARTDAEATYFKVNGTECVKALGGGGDQGRDNIGGNGGSNAGNRSRITTPQEFNLSERDGDINTELVKCFKSYAHKGGVGFDNGLNRGFSLRPSAGGGGATEDGGDVYAPTTNKTTGVITYAAGKGGEGLKLSITGTETVYGSGGGGGITKYLNGNVQVKGYDWVAGKGGTGAGNGTNQGNGGSATANQGGGGGGSAYGTGGNGGSGILVFRYAEPVESPAVVQIGETTYTSIPDAIAAANEGDTIKVIAEVNVDAAINVAKKVTIDLNGQTVRATEKDTVGDGVFCVVAGGDLTINDSVGTGVVNGVGGNPYNMAIWANGGKVTINGGTYTNEGAQDSGPDGAHFDLIYAKNGGEVVINGGYFKCETPNFTLNCHDASHKAGNTSIVVKGGTFYKFNPSNNTAEGAGTDFCADGYAGLSNLDDEFVVGVMPTATVKNLGSMTIPAKEHYVYNGSLNPGTEEMPLNFVMQFVADQKAGDMATSPFADWYGDFVISFEGIENGSFDASGCYLAGYYGSTESWDGLWVKIPVDGILKTIREGERYPVMLGVGMAQTYNYICSGVQAFSCAMYIPDEILKANPNLKVKLELNVVDSSKGEEVAKNALVNGENIFNASDTEYTVEDFKKEEAVKLYIRIVDGKPQIGFEGEGTLVLEAAVTLTGEWTKNISYTIVENDGDDTNTWVTPAESYYFFKGFITK